MGVLAHQRSWPFLIRQFLCRWSWGHGSTHLIGRDKVVENEMRCLTRSGCLEPERGIKCLRKLRALLGRDRAKADDQDARFLRMRWTCHASGFPS
ncbi:hypothetical protein ASAP_0341 [Asaia bogorensis]|uniref:Uncharacterized protein n=1 Tax=Asaia bogorensis TaxID=91915 RepID=A0A060QGI9_9PROT|nr:hypothetical protein ASAP_0341 [Asaia bogorensis]